MMPNITRGRRIAGLLVYLAGPGRANEHTEPHLVAGDSAIMAWHDDAELNRDAALDIAWAVDHPRRAFNTNVSGGPVWHCSLSLHRDEGQLTDEQWAHISEQFIDGMGFGATDTSPPCRWVSLRHGQSKNGNDHVHIVVSPVREDGTVASLWKDQPKAQRVAGELERRHGLAVLESRELARGARGYSPAERARAERLGAPALPRDTLSRAVRASAAGAESEADFIRRLRAAGVHARPRFAAGRADVVTGYSVALPPAPGAAPIWYGGGQLGRDLTLPRLRHSWPDSPAAAAEAVREWSANKRRPASPAPQTPLTPAACEASAQELAALRARLRSVSPDDRDTWAQVANETAGAFAAWSLRTEPTPGPLAATADALARSAQLRASHVQPRRAPLPALRGASLILAAAARGGHGTTAQAVLVRQLANLAKALHDAHRAAGEAQRAAAIAAAVRDHLADVARRLPTATAVADRDALDASRLASVSHEPNLPPRPPGSPIPPPGAAPSLPRSRPPTKTPDLGR